MNSFVPAKKPQPSANHYACGKCFGTGFYCMGTLNGKPYSHTGFTCYPCGGAGWFLSTRPATVAAPLPALASKPMQYRTIAEAKRVIQAAIDSSDRALYKALLLIYSKQTATEQEMGATVEDNGIGFSGCDAELLTSFAKGLTQYGHLTEKQLPYARKKVRKYWRQLMTLAKQSAGA